MSVALEQFVKQLESSGIISLDTLREFLPPKRTPRDAEDLARELLRQKMLTKFQAEELCRGRGKSLIVGNYLLLEKIGEGGMGQVFKAEHRRMRRMVALKVLPSKTMKDPAAVMRFEREAAAAAKLSHPNIVTAFDADCANGIYFLAMELVEGENLASVVKDTGPVEVTKAVDYLLQVARGLAAAHAAGIVHRDIKPSNLLLDRTGTVKVLDLGLARFHGDIDNQAQLTATGAILGTVDYIAPEQALNSKQADARADIYSLGCTLFYLLNGKAAYSGDSLMAKLLAHREQPIPSLSGYRIDVPEQLHAIFQKMVAKRVEDRYQSMTELIADLARCDVREEPLADTLVTDGSGTDSGLTDFLKEVSLAPPTRRSSGKAATQVPKTAAATVPGSKPGSQTDRRVKQVRNLWSDARKRRTILLRAGIAGAALVLCAILYGVLNQAGTLVVSVNEPDAIVQVLDLKGQVEATRKAEKGSVSLSVVPGRHHLKVAKEGFGLFTMEFEIKSGRNLPVKARLLPDTVRKAAYRAGNNGIPGGMSGSTPGGVPRPPPSWSAVADRSAARWVLSQGGEVGVRVEGQPTATVTSAAQLPGEDFQLTDVSLKGTSVSDADLERLEDMQTVQRMTVTGSKMSASGVSALRKMLPRCRVEWLEPRK